MISIKKVKYVEFILENCECLRVDGQFIGNFAIDDIKKSIMKHYNSIIYQDTCSLFAIAINRNANRDYQVFGIEVEHQNLFKRLSEGDICSARIVYSDESLDEVNVDWIGESDYHNEAQDSYVSKNGDLYIVINKDSNVEKYFGCWDIDRPGIADMMWDLK
ncbi:hypothetical protein ACH6EH_07055 [Paenibacillus sp. JSM ZJ436]|uniref:hypothetical protein n=1 Tax=Paenibacillus sp. JSM ZJ436 TaxID=3376190 RepID=UPI003798C017